ncbi:MAG: hypothetical protein IKQ46_01065 [Bacteroidales bacterium]|nr:hypothetical protein [Bacteroidales bacterium]
MVVNEYEITHVACYGDSTGKVHEILDCKIGPNPNNGNFTLFLDLDDAKDVILSVYSINNLKFIMREKLTGFQILRKPLYLVWLRYGVRDYTTGIRGEQEESTRHRTNQYSSYRYESLTLLLWHFRRSIRPDLSIKLLFRVPLKSIFP